MYLSRVFWKSTGERAVKTFFQAVLAAGIIGVTPLLSINWLDLLSIGAGAALLSAITSLAGSQFGTSGDPSLVGPLAVGDEAPKVRRQDFVDADEFEEAEIDETPVPDDYEPRH